VHNYNRTSSISVPVRQTSSADSDSDYGARAHKKKKKLRPSADELRVSSRGTKVPNYVDDVQDFEKFEEQDEDSNSYYVDPNIQYQEEDEIETVLGHSREEGREDDPEDNWFENVVSTSSVSHHPDFKYTSGSDFISNGKTFLISTIPMRPTNSSSVSEALSGSTTTSKATKHGNLAWKLLASREKMPKLSTLTGSA